MKRKITFISGIVGASLFIVASILGGLQIEGYSVVSQYISESYATGLPNTDYLRYMYMASGLLLAIFAFMAITVLPSARGVRVGLILFGIFYGLGTMTTGFFPCDKGCSPDPEDATLSQFIHNTAGFLVYSIVPFCLIGIGFAAKKVNVSANFSKIPISCGILALAFVLLLFGNPQGQFIGLFQRIIEGSILFWVVYASFYMGSTKNHATR